MIDSDNNVTMLDDEQADIEAAKRDAMAEQVKQWEKRIEARPDPEPAPEPEPEKKPAGQLVRWSQAPLQEGNILLLLVGQDEQRRCPILHFQAFRIAGMRENGKLILKPAKLEPKG